MTYSKRQTKDSFFSWYSAKIGKVVFLVTTLTCCGHQKFIIQSNDVGFIKSKHVNPLVLVTRAVNFPPQHLASISINAVTPIYASTTSATVYCSISATVWYHNANTGNINLACSSTDIPLRAVSCNSGTKLTMSPGRLRLSYTASVTQSGWDSVGYIKNISVPSYQSTRIWWGILMSSSRLL